MIGSNFKITSYRLQVDSEGKQTYVPSATIKGVPVRIDREQTTSNMYVDIDNVFDIFRLESDRKLDVQSNDKVKDQYDVEYRVHTVMREYAPEYGNHTICILTKKREF